MKCDLGVLLKIVDRKAKTLHDGHWTLLSFTTHYKAKFGTPNLDQIAELKGYSTLEEALLALIINKD